ncbi:glycosyltransferase family 2 protein, partial [Campylobacter jejuni]|uniref:glycosyltransferase family 2 protein n=1 Tax=Campylobacter jejuni TaxID=197 RepID=UPI0018736B46
DDYWELNCIEECVPRMDGVEVVWFDSFLKLEDGLKKEWKSLIELYRYNSYHIISSEAWLQKAIELNLDSFYFTWQGMINFRYLKNIKLKFINYIIHQDHYFGMVLFGKSQNIFTLPLKLYNYRIRNNSTIHYNQDAIVPEYLTLLYSKFNDIFLFKKYHSKASLCLTLFYLLEFVNEQKNILFIKAFLYRSIYMCLDILDIKQDPWNVKEKFLISFRTYLATSNFSFHQFHSKYGTAKQRIQNQLCYKLGQTMIINSKSIIGILFMPIYLLSTFLNYKQDQKIYHQKIKKDPTLKLPPLENYPDYQEALKYKEHLSYKLGKILLESFKTWHKGGLFKFPFLAKGVKKRSFHG